VPERHGRKARVRSFVVALALAALASSTAAAGASAVPAKFWGIVPQSLPPEEVFQRLKRGGVDSYRFPIEWGAVESVEGQQNWNYVDAQMAGAAANGLEPLPFVTGAPTWAIKQVSVNRQAHSFAPRNLPVSGRARADWETFLREAVVRYGPGGAFWHQHPELTEKPIRTWQIWNEPNFKYFVARPSGTEYGKLVKLSYTAVRTVDPGAKLLLAGLFARPREALGRYKKIRPRPALLATEFLRQMYRGNHGIKSKFVGVALHPYSVAYEELEPRIEEVRKVLREAGDGAKGLWITELGWSSKTATANNQFAKGKQGQIREMTGAFKLLERRRAKWRIQRVFWFSVDDRPGLCNFCDGTGLFTQHFVAKSSWKAFARLAGGTP
jgi:hypothetical protein